MGDDPGEECVWVCEPFRGWDNNIKHQPASWETKQNKKKNVELTWTWKRAQNTEIHSVL